MPSLYPSSYDSLTDPVANQPRDTLGMKETDIIGTLNDAVENIQEYLGTSAETSTEKITGKVKQLDTATTKGDLLYHNGTQLTRLPRGTDGYLLASDATDGVKYIAPTSGGNVTDVSVVSANGFTGSVANETTSPDITIGTSITGLLKGNGTAVSSATQGTDYYAPSGTDVGVADGGTGVSSLTAFAPIFGGTTTTGPVQQVSVGTAGQVLTSNGAGALPTMQTVAGNKIYLSTTQATRSGSAEVTMYSFTLPANTLGTSGAIEATVYISGLGTTGSGSDMSVTVKHGTTLIGNLTVTTNNTSAGKGELKFILAATGSTSSQKVLMNCMLGGGVGGSAYTSQAYSATGTSTFDSTSDQTININTFPSAGGQSCIMEGISVTKIV